MFKVKISQLRIKAFLSLGTEKKYKKAITGPKLQIFNNHDPSSFNKTCTLNNLPVLKRKLGIVIAITRTQPTDKPTYFYCQEQLHTTPLNTVWRSEDSLNFTERQVFLLCRGKEQARISFLLPSPPLLVFHEVYYIRATITETSIKKVHKLPRKHTDSA